MQESQPTSPKLSLDEIRNKIIFEMQKGKESLQIIRSISLQYPRLKLEDGYQNDDQDIHKRLDHHSMLALNAYVYSLSMLKNCNFERPLKRKIEYLDENVSHQGSSMDVTNDTTSGKGRYKRSKSAEAREQEVTNLTDDGFAWRKYGQKAIHNSKHPRNYYRCTHKHDQKCQATKQVQQISENPTKYKIIYHGNHTCKCILKTNPIIIDDTEEHSSGIFFSFDQSNKQHNPAMLFPTANVTAVKQEHESPIKQEMPSISHDSNSYNVHSSLNSPPSSNNVSFSQDATEITGLSYTPVSEQSDMISTAENYQDNVGEEDYSYIWAELEVFEDLCAYNYN